MLNPYKARFDLRYMAPRRSPRAVPAKLMFVMFLVPRYTVFLGGAAQRSGSTLHCLVFAHTLHVRLKFRSRRLP